MSLLGRVLGGRYQVMEQIGRGGTGEVYLVVDQYVHRRRAMKELKDAYTMEAELLMRLHHPAIASATELITEGDRSYLVTEYIDGCTLEERLEQNRERIDEAGILCWAFELADVLVYLHGLSPPVVHSDIKPGNIMVDREGHLRLIDFGIARESGTVVRGQKAYGSVGFAPPEQYGDKNGHLLCPIDTRADLYAFGKSMEYVIERGCVKVGLLLRLIIRHCRQDSLQYRFRSTTRMRTAIRAAKAWYTIKIRLRKKSRYLPALTLIFMVLIQSAGFPAKVSEPVSRVETMIGRPKMETGRPKECIPAGELPEIDELQFFTSCEEMETELAATMERYLEADASIAKYRGILRLQDFYAPFMNEDEEALIKSIGLLETGAEEITEMMQESETGYGVKGQDITQTELKKLFALYNRQLFKQYRILGKRRLQKDQTGALKALNRAAEYGEEACLCTTWSQEDREALVQDLEWVNRELGATKQERIIGTEEKD